MSRYSHEHHVRAPQQAILELMEVFFQAQACQSFEVALLPRDMEERRTFIDVLYQADHDQLFYVVSPTDIPGWTILWSDYDEYYQDQLIAFLSERLQTTALYGHDNDQVDNWRWILFEKGKEVASYWYLGRKEDMWVNMPECCAAPPGAMTLGEAFNAQGRTYQHLNLESAGVSGWYHISLPLELFRFVSISDCPN